METTSNRLLVPYDEARHKLGDIGRTLLYDLIDQKKLVRVSIGRRGFITTKSLEQYVDSLTQAAEVDGQLALFEEPARCEKRFVPLGGQSE
jgi:hypothetical protein